MRESDEVMVEAFMEGTEISQGCYKTQEKEVVLPATEVVSDNEFFDYNAKYNGQVREITPARLKEETAERVSLITSMIYDILGCSGIIRVDYIITHTTDENGTGHDRHQFHSPTGTGCRNGHERRVDRHHRKQTVITNLTAYAYA